MGTGLILDIDWNAAYQQKRLLHHPPDDRAYWDGRAPQFAEHQGKSSYIDDFLQLLDIEPGQSVLDVGCGPGSLAIPLAKLGHKVIAGDFSEAMLDTVRTRASDENLSNITPLALDWNGDWQAAGLEPNCVDVAIASRSTIVNDLQEALLKLDSVAKHKVAITVVTESGPKHEYQIGEIVDGLPYVPDYVFAMNILFQLGRHPELNYIKSTAHLPGEPPKPVIWAFIAWEPHN